MNLILKTTYHDPAKTKVSSTLYEDSNGIKQGPSTFYRLDGTVSETFFYKDDRYHGENVYFEKDGKTPFEMKTWNNGKFVEGSLISLKPVQVVSPSAVVSPPLTTSSTDSL